MFYWRKHKPFLLIANLVDFRKFMHKTINITANQWFDFCSREADETADLGLLRQHTNDRLVRGSNAATLQEPCLACECVMPGTCYQSGQYTFVSQKFIKCFAKGPYLFDDIMKSIVAILSECSHCKGKALVLVDRRRRISRWISRTAAGFDTPVNWSPSLRIDIMARRLKESPIASANKHGEFLRVWTIRVHILTRNDTKKVHQYPVTLTPDETRWEERQLATCSPGDRLKYDVRARGRLGLLSFTFDTDIAHT